MTITTTQFKTEIENRIAAATGSTTLKDLTLIKANADLWLSNNVGGTITGYAALETLIQAKQDTLSGASSLTDLSFVGVSAFPPVVSNSKPVAIGQTVQLNPAFPPTIELDGMKFVKNGYAVQSGYDPVLENHKSILIGFNLITPTGFYSNITKVVGTTSGAWIAVNGTSVIRSTNKGVTWSAVILPAGIYTLDYIDSYGDTVIIAPSNKMDTLLKSTDAGITWVAVTVASLSSNFTGIKASSNGWIVWCYSNTYTNVLISKDNAATWASKSTTSYSYTRSVAIQENTIVLKDGQFSSNIRVSYDFGDSWTNIQIIVNGISKSATDMWQVGDTLLFIGNSSAPIWCNINEFKFFQVGTSDISNISYLFEMGGVVYYGGTNDTSLRQIPLKTIKSSGLESTTEWSAHSTFYTFSVGVKVGCFLDGIAVFPTTAGTLFKSNNAVGIDMDEYDSSFFMRYK